jgi:hypothetical protein
MRSLVLPALLGSLLASKGDRAVAQTDRSPSSNYIVGEPIRHKNLTIFPVLSKTDQNMDRYTTLDEGLRTRTVEVIEIGAAGSQRQTAATEQQAAGRAAQRPSGNPPLHTVIVQNPRARAHAAESTQANYRDAQVAENNEVNRLMVVNKSGKPLYLMPGEVIVGGDQDRTIGEETVVASTGKPVPIDVFCVEHGRWSRRGEAESTSLYAALGATSAKNARELADEARKGYFSTTAAPLSKAGRVAVQSDKSQQAVWDNVAKNNSALNVDSESGTFTNSYVDKRVQGALEPYIMGLSAKVAAQGRVVGAIVAINGKIESLDVFESTPLFRKLWPKLLKSYALDAMSATATAKPAAKDKSGTSAKHAAKESTVVDASAFLVKVLQASVRDTKQTQGGLVVTHRETKGATSYSAGGMGGGMGGPVHAAGYAP